MKVVLDTNVWISSLLLPRSIPGKIVNAWQHNLFKVVTSDPILQEIKEVLAYPKIRKRLKVDDEEIEKFLTLIRFFTEIVLLKNNDFNDQNPRDLDDAPILSTFILSKADYLITGDKDLLALNKEYLIVTPSKFAEFLE